MMYPAMKIASTLALLACGANASENGEEARWLVSHTNWGTLQWLEAVEGDEDAGAVAQSMVASYGESDGRIFYYLPSIDFEFKGSLTLSEAAVDPSQFDGAKCGPDGALDPEDPRCAKLTISGTISPCGDDTKEFGLQTLYASHPQMESWPEDHGFIVHEMQIEQLWMIANYGGGGFLAPQEYTTAEPIHHPVQGFPHFRQLMEDGVAPRPDFTNDVAGHARWLVAKSLWTTVSTIDSREEGQAFGNIRSVVDGGCFLDSSGLPYFYLPSPDPTAIDVNAKNSIVLSFTEAALASRVLDGATCGGMDAMDPTCARINLVGTAKELDGDEQVQRAEASFAAQHPRAEWLSQGGAHTGGSYYTIDIESIEFLRNYGGYAVLTVEDYVGWEPDAEGYDGEEQCSTSDWEGSTIEDNHSSYHTHDAHSSNGDGMGEEYHEHDGMGEGHHEHGGMGEGHHEHGEMDGEDHHGYGHEEYAEEYESSTDETKSISIGSFALGTAFGFVIWGPTVALIVYHKSCGRGRHEVAVEYKPAMMA